MTGSPPPFVFVVGCGRSGTTVLRTVLDSHPDLAVSHEGRFVAPLGLRRARYERPEGFATDRLIADLTADRAVRTNLEFDEDDVRAALAGPAPEGFPDAVRRIFAHYAEVRGKSRYGDKFPGYVLRMDLLAGMFPEARFVHIVRDGRDVALSYRAIAPADAVTLAFDWRSRVSAGRAAGATLGPARYQEVRYEDLVTDPRPTVEGLCGFLDLAFDPAMLDSRRHGARRARQGRRPTPATPASPSRCPPAPARGAPTWTRPTSPPTRPWPATC